MSTSAAQATAFYREAVAHGSVWTIRDDGGVPAPMNRDGQRAMPFWSRRSRAHLVIATVDAYRGFELEEIPLREWRERWLTGLKRDGLLVGLNWSGAQAQGYDVEPDAVVAALGYAEDKAQ